MPNRRLYHPHYIVEELKPSLKWTFSGVGTQVFRIVDRRFPSEPPLDLSQKAKNFEEVSFPADRAWTKILLGQAIFITNEVRQTVQIIPALIGEVTKAMNYLT